MGRPIPWREIANDCDMPISMHPPTVQKGCHLPKMYAAMAMKPLPAVIPFVNLFTNPKVSSAPANAAKAPLKIIARYFILKTLMPEVSALNGSLPVALM